MWKSVLEGNFRQITTGQMRKLEEAWKEHPDATLRDIEQPGMKVTHFFPTLVVWESRLDGCLYMKGFFITGDCCLVRCPPMCRYRGVRAPRFDEV